MKIRGWAVVDAYGNDEGLYLDAVRHRAELRASIIGGTVEALVGLASGGRRRDDAAVPQLLKPVDLTGGSTGGAGG